MKLTSPLQRLINRLQPKIQPRVVDFDGHSLQAQEYAGFTILYSPGTSLISRLRTAKDLYEPKLVKAIWKEITTRKAQIFMDVGANIGLVSLAVIRKSRRLRIEAFEPGPHQFRLFSSTIRYNCLQSSINLHPFALGDFNGVADFFVHADEHVSGDGLFDTGRAGKSNVIRVPIRRLDDWWLEAGQPVITIVKIDTEGAELLILEGAEKFILACHPTLFLEIWPANLTNYGYNASDILSWLLDHNYVLYTLKGTKIPSIESSMFWGKESTFIGKP